MLELRKKGNKHWLLIDEDIGEFTPSKFTINRLNNVINVVYFNNLKSKEYNVSDCYIFDIDDTSGFNTSNGVAFMDKLEELNCPCFQKDVNNFYISGGTWKKEQLSGFTYKINIDNNELSYYELYFVKDDRSKDFSDPNFEVTNNSITINSGFPLDGVVCFYRKIEL